MSLRRGSPIDRTSSYRWRGDADGFEGQRVGDVEQSSHPGRRAEARPRGRSPHRYRRTIFVPEGPGRAIARRGFVHSIRRSSSRCFVEHGSNTPATLAQSTILAQGAGLYSDSEAARVHTFSLVCPLISRPLGHIILKKGEYRRDHGVRLMRVRSTQQLEPWPTTRRGGILVAGSGVRPKQTLTIVFPLPVVSPTHHPAITPTTNQHEHEIRIDSRDGFYC